MNGLQAIYVHTSVILHSNLQDRYYHPSLLMRKLILRGIEGWEELKDDKEK